MYNGYQDVQYIWQASLLESGYTHTPHADMIWSWCQAKGTLYTFSWEFIRQAYWVLTVTVIRGGAIPLPVSCNWWEGPLYGCQMVSRDLETAEDIGRSCWWDTPSTSDVWAHGVKQRVAMESHHLHGSRLTKWLYNEKMWKVDTQNYKMFKNFTAMKVDGASLTLTLKGVGRNVPVPKQLFGSWPNLIHNLWRSPAKTMAIGYLLKITMNWRIMKAVYVEKKHSSTGIGLIALQ